MHVEGPIPASMSGYHKRRWPTVAYTFHKRIEDPIASLETRRHLHKHSNMRTSSLGLASMTGMADSSLARL